MEVECFPKLSKEQQKVLPKNYCPPPIEGTYSINDEHPEGVIYVYVGYCDWEKNFDYCLKEFEGENRGFKPKGFKSLDLEAYVEF